jgi:nitroimidazol reductase NimA-like FMN-containing flavoprotein (pyridoxamine 5'-phosphate oxidase superfamily)
MNTQERDAFLATVRLGILSSLDDAGNPVSVPVWFDWDGAAVRFFSSSSAPKVARLRKRPRASMLVVNSVGEVEAWVAFDGDVTIGSDGAIELAAVLAARCWDLAQPDHAQTLETWHRNAAHFALLTLTPTKIRTS